MAECIFCLNKFASNEKPTTLTKKGYGGIIKAGQFRKKKITPSVGDKFHEKCRKKYLKEAQTTFSENEVSKEFSFDQNCLFCGKEIDRVHCRNSGNKDFHTVKAASFLETIKQIINSREDEWATEVSLRIGNEANLVAVNAVYHQQCNVNFRTHKKNPFTDSSVSKKGAPLNTKLNESFLQLVQFLEASEEPYSTSDLNEKFQEFSGGETYSVRHLKDKLTQHFGDRILFLSRNGLPDIVVMRESSNRIVIKAYEEKYKSCQQIETVAASILNDIRSIKNNKESYPLPNEIESVEFGLSFMPVSLVVFLKTLFSQQKTDVTTKIIAIGHAIIQTCRPRCLLSPIQLGLGVQVSVLTASRFLVDTLHSLGFCCSYAEVRKFRYSAVISSRQIEHEPIPQNNITKYAADNVDHNSCTLDGKGTFHGMGIISINTEIANGNETRIPRVTATEEDVRGVDVVEIIHYSENADDDLRIMYRQLSPSTIYDTFDKLDLLWTLSWPAVPDRPSWSGFMQLVTTGPHVTTPNITYLPMIDLSSSSYTCLYSTMLFIAKQSIKNETTPVLTFDQPLYWKARLIIEHESLMSPLKKIVLMLGGFHMKMSYLGCVGYLMTGSGLQETLEQVYAPNSVIKMLSGKAIARAIRGHLLLHAALNAIICEQTFNESEKLLTATIFDDVLKRIATVDDLKNNSDLIMLEDKLVHTKEKLKSHGPTSLLWLQYVKKLDILKSNIRGDRTGTSHPTKIFITFLPPHFPYVGDFHLHLQTVQAMHPFYAAAGHNNYSKSIQVYLQDMQGLIETNPKVYEYFLEGNFITRRSNRFWAGLPDDLIIEQVLMRRLKSARCLTRGTGFGQVQRTIWLKSMPSCAAINDAMQNFNHKALETSEQHKEIGMSRNKRDSTDTKILYDYLSERNVFAKMPGLRNIVDGTVSNSNCNPYDAEKIGIDIVNKLHGNDSSTFVFRKKDQVVVMNSKNTVQIDEENVEIDPEVLFQRLLFIQNNRSKDDLERVFAYELTQRPPVFFDEKGFLRDGSDFALSDVLWKKIGSTLPTECEILAECVYVLSGDWMINEVVWQKGETFDDICRRYVEFALRKYGKSATVIFNETETAPSITDDKILQNKKGICGSEISFTGATPLKMKKQEFLNNPKNKNTFIRMLVNKLEDAGCTAYSTICDANVLIAQTSARMSHKKMTVAVGEEASLLILLCFYAKTENCGLYLRSHKKQKSAKGIRLWNITETISLLGADKSKYLLFANAFGGCQSTSHIFGVGEGVIYSKLDDKHFAAQAEIFCNRSSTKDEIINAGEQAMVVLFKGKAGQKLNALRFQKYKEKIATETGVVLAKRLPPTESSTKCHSLRTFYQIQTWMQQNKGLNPLHYGWNKTTDRLTPILTELPPAPATLLSAIRCACKSSCSTNRCKCKDAGLRCTTVCKNCDHSSCKNYENLGEDNVDNEEDFQEYDY